MARELNVKREEVLEMETRLSGGDVALEPQTDDDGEESYAPIAYLADDSQRADARARGAAAATGWPATASRARSTRSTRAAAASSRSAG